MKLPKFRQDVAYLRPNDFEEVGLVTHKPGDQPKHPTLFVGAQLRSKADRQWFERVVKAMTR